MKKTVAILLAVILALSVSVCAFATDDATTAIYKCDFCGETFETAALLTAHIDATFPTYADAEAGLAAHEKACGNHIDVDFDGTYDKVCDKTFTTKAAYEAHQANCDCKDTRDNWAKAKDCIEAGNYKSAVSFAFKGIVEFFKSETFSKIVSTVKNLIGKIDLSGVVSTVKNVAGKIPFDKIGETIKGLF